MGSATSRTPETGRSGGGCSDLKSRTKDYQKGADNYLIGSRLSRRHPGAVWLVSPTAKKLWDYGIKTGWIDPSFPAKDKEGNNILTTKYHLPKIEERILFFYTRDLNIMLRKRGDPHLLFELLAGGLKQPELPRAFISHIEEEAHSDEEVEEV